MKIALVTGNSTGLGKAFSEHLKNLGYKEPKIIRSKDYDVTDPKQCKELVDEIIKEEGNLDLLINNVGNYSTGYVDNYEVEAWQEMMDSNLNSAFYLSKFTLPYLRKSKGKIINIGYCGLNKLSPPIDVIAYQAAKTGLLVLTKGMAKEEIKHGITVNMISPGSLENTIEDDSVLKIIPAARFAKLDEACQMLEYFLNNDYVTGQNLELAGARAL